MFWVLKRDGYQQQLFWLRNKQIIFGTHSLLNKEEGKDQESIQ